MHILIVDLHVKPEFLDQFRAATIENARNSINEAGILRFDFVQRTEDPTRFALVEVYRTPADADLHKQTAHYLTWRDTVSDMMVEPRVAAKYVNIFPGEDGWD